MAARSGRVWEQRWATAPANVLGGPKMRLERSLLDGPGATLSRKELQEVGGGGLGLNMTAYRSGRSMDDGTHGIDDDCQWYHAFFCATRKQARSSADCSAAGFRETILCFLPSIAQLCVKLYGQTDGGGGLLG